MQLLDESLGWVFSQVSPYHNMPSWRWITLDNLGAPCGPVTSLEYERNEGMQTGAWDTAIPLLLRKMWGSESPEISPQLADTWEVICSQCLGTHSTQPCCLLCSLSTLSLLSRGQATEGIETKIVIKVTSPCWKCFPSSRVLSASGQIGWRLLSEGFFFYCCCCCSGCKYEGISLTTVFFLVWFFQ